MATHLAGEREDKNITAHLPADWSLVWYGIEKKNTAIRRKLCHQVQLGGLWKVDIGGSVYAGPTFSELDNVVQQAADKLMPGQVRVLPGKYSGAEAEWLMNGVMKNAMQDLKEVEDAIDELEQAMTPGSGVVIVNPKTKEERNLVTTGDGRFHTAAVLLQGVDTVAQRMAAYSETKKQAELLRKRCTQVQAWVEKVKKAHSAFSAGKRTRRGADEA